MSIEYFKHIYFRLPIIVRLLVTVLALMIFFGVIIHFVEPKQFPSIFDGIWWAFVTGATVGYGDYVPLSVAGRVIGILLILSGGGILTFYVTTLSAETVQHERNLSKGKVAYKGQKHIIFVGWNERTSQLLDLIIRNGGKHEIVLIDRTLRHLSYKQLPVHFIHGDASEDTILRQANIASAQRVIISADRKEKEREADNYTILTTVAIRGNNKDVPIIAEILLDRQVENALRAGATTIIRSNDFMSALFYHELFHIKSSKPFETVIQLLISQQFSHIILPQKLANATFLEASAYFLKQNYLLLGIIRHEKWKINPPPDFALLDGDILVTLSDWQ